MFYINAHVLDAMEIYFSCLPCNGNDNAASRAEPSVGARVRGAVAEVLDGGEHAHLGEHGQGVLLAVSETT